MFGRLAGYGTAPADDTGTPPVQVLNQQGHLVTVNTDRFSSDTKERTTYAAQELLIPRTLVGWFGRALIISGISNVWISAALLYWPLAFGAFPIAVLIAIAYISANTGEQIRAMNSYAIAFCFGFGLALSGALPTLIQQHNTIPTVTTYERRISF